MFIHAGGSLLLALAANEGVVVTSDAPSVVVDVGTATTIQGVTRFGMDSRALFYGTFATPKTVSITATVDADVEPFRGSLYRHTTHDFVILTQSEISNPTPEILNTIDVTYRLNVPPYTRYWSDGTQLVSWGAGAGAPDVTDITYSGSLTVGSPLTFGHTNIGGAITSRSWVFRINGTQVDTDSGATPVKTFGAPGTLTVEITATGAGGSDFYSETIGTLISGGGGGSALSETTTGADLLETTTGLALTET